MMDSQSSFNDHFNCAKSHSKFYSEILPFDFLHDLIIIERQPNNKFNIYFKSTQFYQAFHHSFSKINKYSLHLHLIQLITLFPF